MKNLQDVMECPFYKVEESLDYTFNTQNKMYFPKHINVEDFDYLVKIKVPIINLEDFLEYNLINFKEYLLTKFKDSVYIPSIDYTIALLGVEANRFSKLPDNKHFFFPYNIPTVDVNNLYHKRDKEVFAEVIKLFNDNPEIRFIIKGSSLVKGND